MLNKHKEKSAEHIQKVKKKPEYVTIGENSLFNYHLAGCCNPIPGDEIFAYINTNDQITIHQTVCSKARKLMVKYGHRIIQARWDVPEVKELDKYTVGLVFTGFDQKGLLARLTDIISKEMKINMKSINAEAKNGTFEGKIVVEVLDTAHLEDLIKRMREIEGVFSVKRVHV